MSLLSVDDLKALVEQPQRPCVSMYMPTYKAGSEIRQNPICFKNLIREAEAKLQELSAIETSSLLQPALDLDKKTFWQQLRISTSKGGTANAAQQVDSFHGQGSPDRDLLNATAVKHCWMAGLSMP